jgi:hypothetical protein
VEVRTDRLEAKRIPAHIQACDSVSGNGSIEMNKLGLTTAVLAIRAAIMGDRFDWSRYNATISSTQGYKAVGHKSQKKRRIIRRRKSR